MGGQKREKGQSWDRKRYLSLAVLCGPGLWGPPWTLVWSVPGCRFADGCFCSGPWFILSVTGTQKGCGKLCTGCCCEPLCHFSDFHRPKVQVPLIHTQSHTFAYIICVQVKEIQSNSIVYLIAVNSRAALQGIKGLRGRKSRESFPPQNRRRKLSFSPS